MEILDYKNTHLIVHCDEHFKKNLLSALLVFEIHFSLYITGYSDIITIDSSWVDYPYKVSTCDGMYCRQRRHLYYGGLI
jgi:hypothetical protein